MQYFSNFISIIILDNKQADARSHISSFLWRPRWGENNNKHCPFYVFHCFIAEVIVFSLVSVKHFKKVFRLNKCSLGFPAAMQNFLQQCLQGVIYMVKHKGYPGSVHLGSQEDTEHLSVTHKAAISK